jgi:hypothetical protein
MNNHLPCQLLGGIVSTPKLTETVLSCWITTEATDAGFSPEWIIVVLFPLALDLSPVLLETPSETSAASFLDTIGQLARRIILKTG